MDGQKYSVSELAQSLNDWCGQHQVQPLHNGAGPQVTVRTIRYYQTLGLVDRPVSADGRGFHQKHRLQLVGIRLLQAKGLPLGKIQRLLSGRTEEELREVERRGLNEINLSPAPSHPGSTDWELTSINESILVLTRSGQEITVAQRLKIQEILSVKPTEEWGNIGPESFRPETD